MRNKWFARFLAAAFAVSVLLQPGGAALASEVQDTFDVAAEVKEGESVEVDKASSAPENVESLHEDSAEAVPSEVAPSEGVDFQVNPDEVAGESGTALPREQDGINDTEGAMSRSTKVEILQTPFPSSQPSDDHTSNIEFRSPAPPYLGSQDGTVNGEYLASGSYGNVVWMIDANGKLTVNGTGEYTDGRENSRSPWYNYREMITAADINLADVRNVSCMFYDCRNLINLDLSNFDTSNVTNMYKMFWSCSNLVNLDLSNFDTSNVTSMGYMFSDCRNKTLDLSNFDTGNVTDMKYMFSGCSNLTTLDLSNFDTGNVTDMEHMFGGCSNLTTLDLSNFDTGNVTDMGGMFNGCNKLTVLGLSNFDTGNVTDMRSMFFSCFNLTTLDLSNFDTGNVTDMNGMFYNCSNLTMLDLSNFNTGNVTDTGFMFYGCNNLTMLDLSNFDTSNVTDMEHMFNGCNNLTTLNLSNFDTGNVTRMGAMFFGCSSLTTLDLSNFDTGNVTTFVTTFMDGMFDKCSKLVTLNTPYNVHQSASLPTVENTVWHFPDGTETTELPQGLDHSVTLTRHDTNSGEEPEPAAPQELPIAVKFAPYDTSLQTPDASVSLISGNLPIGLTLASDGRLSGVPTENGSFAFTVQAADNAGGSTREISYTLSVTEDTASNFDAYADPGYELTEVVPNQYFESIPDEGTQLVVSAGSFEEFTALYLDGEKLQDGADYTAESGSTRITILNQTLKRKGTGTHTLALEFRTKATGALKWAAQNYVIAEGKAPSESEGQETDTDNNNGGNHTGTDNSADDNDTTENTASVIAYQVKHGDTLSKLAQRFYGSSSNWRRIFTDNAATIRNPNRIFPGQTLIITVAQNSASAEGQSTASNQTASNVGLTNSYTVVSGDNLYKIAQKVYGQGGRWNEIYQANKNVISNPGRIYAGQVLLIP